MSCFRQHPSSYCCCSPFGCACSKPTPPISNTKSSSSRRQGRTKHHLGQSNLQHRKRRPLRGRIGRTVQPQILSLSLSLYEHLSPSKLFVITLLSCRKIIFFSNLLFLLSSVLSSSSLQLKSKPIFFVTAQVPGLVYTESGYDNEFGTDPICWVAPAYDRAQNQYSVNIAQDSLIGTAADEFHGVNISANGNRRRGLGSGGVGPATSFVFDGKEATTDITTESKEEDYPDIVRNANMIHNGSTNPTDKNNEGDDRLLSIPSNSTNRFNGYNWPNDLVPSFIAGPTSMLATCPRGLFLRVDAPVEFVNGDILRTGQPYIFHVEGSIQLSTIRALLNLPQQDTIWFFYSSDGTHRVALQLLFCPVNGNFCSPFLIQEAHDDNEDHRDVEEDQHSDGEYDGRRDESSLNSTDHHHELSTTYFLYYDNLNETNFQFNIDVEVTVQHPGPYLPLGTLQFFLANDTIYEHEQGVNENAAYKIDVANVLHQRIIYFRNHPEIRSVRKEVEVLVYVLIGMSAAIVSGLLVATIWYRNSSVFTLSQGTFLIVLLGAALVATVCSFLFNPKSDLFCKLKGPLVMIPLQLILAIIIGRLRRIITVMRPLMVWHTDIQEKTLWSRCRLKFGSMLPEWSWKPRSVNSFESDVINIHNRIRSLFDMRRVPKQKSLRAQFSSSRLCLWIVLVTFPQIAIQIIGLAAFSVGRSLELNEDESIGRYECECKTGSFFYYVQYIVLSVTLLYLVVESQSSRNLPSLFNEAFSLSAAAIATMITSVLGIVIIASTSEPTSSPDATYIVTVAIILCLTLNFSVRLIYPKLKLVWKGEKVVMSKILREHKNNLVSPKTKERESEASDSRKAYFSASDAPKALDNVREVTETSIVDEADLNGDADRKQKSSIVGRGKRCPSNAASEVTWGSSFMQEDSQVDGLGENDSTVLDADELESSAQLPAPVQCEKNQSEWRKQKQKVSFAEQSGPSHSSDKTPWVIREDHTPPTALTARIVKHAELSSRVNGQILSGLQVPRKDWETL